MANPKAYPAEDARRVEALDALDLLSTPLEPAYQDILQLVRGICGTPSALINLIDADTQWIQASVGWQGDRTPREVAFCDKTIRGERPLVVEDASSHPEFQENPLVTGDPKIRFYAGVPLHSPQGIRIGALCAIDMQPRAISELQLEQLKALARNVERMFLTRQTLAKVTAAEKAAQETFHGEIQRRFAQQLRPPLLALVVQNAVLSQETNLSERGHHALRALQDAMDALTSAVEGIAAVKSGRDSLRSTSAQRQEQQRSIDAYQVPGETVAARREEESMPGSQPRRPTR